MELDFFDFVLFLQFPSGRHETSSIKDVADQLEEAY